MRRGRKFRKVVRDVGTKRRCRKGCFLQQAGYMVTDKKSRTVSIKSEIHGNK